MVANHRSWRPIGEWLMFSKICAFSFGENSFLEAPDYQIYHLKANPRD